MGLTQFSRIHLHWKKSELYHCSLCPQIMKRSEFFLLQSFIHYVDNTTADINDKLYKVRNLFNMLTIRFQRYYVLNREITIDERMIKYTGRPNFLQFIRNKPTQWGFKVLCLLMLTMVMCIIGRCLQEQSLEIEEMQLKTL